MHLLLQGFEVKTAVNGEEAISILENESFDLVLLDIEMPKMDGLEVLHYIKTRHIDVRPIMLTGADNLLALNECAQWGAFDYLPKPYNYHELMDSIERVLAEGGHTGRSENSGEDPLLITQKSSTPNLARG
jgi:DNA-binding NtrC family response regulator